MSRAMTREQYQEKIDGIYGAGEWTIQEYTGTHSPLVAIHKCGAAKRLTRASTFSSRGKDKCQSCHDKETGRSITGRPRLLEEDIRRRVSEETYGTYEVVSFVSGSNFVVRHKSCDRKPFRTSAARFFNRGARCQCNKKGLVGRKPNSYINLNSDCE
ncbi:MAG: hypothetical protein ACRDDY_04710 [Clostridium sp.]|uniref:hypothetical protein n=1 Tax=Clostridium sp. TaxID=1506 RepID=UPI003EE5280C